MKILFFFLAKESFRTTLLATAGINILANNFCSYLRYSKFKKKEDCLVFLKGGFKRENSDRYFWWHWKQIFRMNEK